MKSVKFTGGEPFAYKYLPELVRFAYTLGIEPTIVTNGTLLAEKHIHFLRETGSRIKISIHGPKQIHNSMQGAEVFDRAVETLQMLIRLGIETSVHTLVRRNNPLNYDDWIKFLANEHVNKVSFIPFITRGRGKDVSPEWSLTEDEIELLKGSIQELQNRYRNKIKVRYIDFLNQAYFVFESNGNLILESSNEENDVLLCHASEICL